MVPNSMQIHQVEPKNWPSPARPGHIHFVIGD